MITKTLTGITLTNNPNLDYFYNINDTFIAGQPLNFTCPLSTLNTLTSLSINSSNIGIFNLYVIISDNVIGTTINSILFEQNIILTSKNINNNSFIVDISSITNKLSHDYLCDNMNQTEIYNLYKNYKIIFKIYTGTLVNKTTIETNDFIQDLNVVLNTAETGPYNVKLHELDILSPNDFSSTARLSIYAKYPLFYGGERIRIFYPENIEKNSKCPLILFSHGNGQYTSGYDLYLSDLASYGYVCASITINPDNCESQSQLAIDLIDHLKENISILDGGIISNVINFNKINFGGHSRGGCVAIVAAKRLQNKQYIINVKNSTINFSDIKSLLLFADAANGICIFKDIYNLVFPGYINSAQSPLITTQAITEADLKYFDMYMNIPIFNIQGTEDGDSTATDVLYGYGFSYDIKRNIPEIVDIIPEHLRHGELQSFSKFSQSDYYSHTTPVTGSPRWSYDESKFVYNTNLPKLNDIKSEMIFFLARQNFSSKTTKKLNYNHQRLTDKKIYKENKQLITSSIRENYNDIKYIIDSFSGITLSLAGITGVTFSPKLGATGCTYDYAIDRSNIDALFAVYNLNQPQFKAYRDAVTQNRIKLNSGEFTQSNDFFSGIIGFNYRGLGIGVSYSDILIGYTFSNSLTFNENNYFVLNGALQLSTIPSKGNTMNAHCNMTLFDGSNNFASISSRVRGDGFKAPFNLYSINTTDYDAYAATSQPTYYSNVYFRAGDFSLKNPSLDLNNINRIMLSFGPNYGSTFAKICFDEFLCLKEV